MSDEPKPPADAGDPPPVPPTGRRGKKRGARRGAWSAPAATLAGAPAVSPRIILFVVSLSMVFVLFAVAKLLGAFDDVASDPAAAALRAAAAPKIGTSAAAIAADEKAVAGKREFAEGLFGPELWTVRDGDEIGEEPEWRKVAETMAGLDPAFVVEHLDFSLNVNYEEVKKDPARYRGRFVRMRGLVAKNFHANKLANPVAGRGDVYRGLILDTDGECPVIFDVLDRPPPFKKMPDVSGVVFSSPDAVDVDGVFYRMIRYESQGGRMVETPWIVARTVVRCQPDEQDADSSVGLVVGGLAAFLALAVSIVYLVRRGRRKTTVAAPSNSPPGFRDMFARKLREEPPKEPPPLA